jgi:hypothetical protein
VSREHSAGEDPCGVSNRGNGNLASATEELAPGHYAIWPEGQDDLSALPEQSAHHTQLLCRVTHHDYHIAYGLRSRAVTLVA